MKQRNGAGYLTLEERNDNCPFQVIDSWKVIIEFTNRVSHWSRSMQIIVVLLSATNLPLSRPFPK